MTRHQEQNQSLKLFEYFIAPVYVYGGFRFHSARSSRLFFMNILYFRLLYLPFVGSLANLKMLQLKLMIEFYHLAYMDLN